MLLTDEEKALLQGEGGYAARKAMEILVALGEIYEAERLLRVSSVQVSGVSYHNLGEAGLEWLESMARDGRVRAVATLNPAGMDLKAWERLGIQPTFAEQQLRVVDAYRRMGLVASCTCTPYLVGNLAARGEHLAWSESSAVTFANTVLGARTNREGGPSALAAALTGRTPAYGLHLTNARVPTLQVALPRGIVGSRTDTAWWGALGCALGRFGKGQVVRVTGAPPALLPELKSFCASYVTYGGSPLIHLAGVTPEAEAWPEPKEQVVLPQGFWEEALAWLHQGQEETLDLVCLGCPHLSITELHELARLLEGHQVRTETWLCTARATAETAAQYGLVEAIEKSGAKVVCDTCFVVAPLPEGVKTIATDSAKGCFYARGHNKCVVRLGSVEECIAAALTGTWRGAR